MDTFRLHEMPKALAIEACVGISHYSIGLVKLKAGEDIEDAEVGGSGTLVQLGDTFAVLTACHVVDHLRRAAVFGLLLANVGEPLPQRILLRSEAVEWRRIARGVNEADGPDLGLLLLSAVDAASLRARKSFYNLSNREWLLQKPPALDHGAWFLCGFAEEATTERAPDRGFGRIKVFEGACGAGWVCKQYRESAFEYLDFEVRYGAVNAPPRDFGGFSGGGLWQVPITRKDGELRVKELLFSGVAFYQSATVDNVGRIKCHGRDGIYTHAVQALQNGAR